MDDPQDVMNPRPNAEPTAPPTPRRGGAPKVPGQTARAAPVTASRWSRFAERGLSRAARWSFVALAGFVLLSGIALPYSWSWYDIQTLDDVVRHPPSWTPAVAAERFSWHWRQDAGRCGGASLPAAAQENDRSGSARLDMAHAAFRAVSWMGHDDLGRSLFYRLLLGSWVSLAIGLGSAAIAVVVGTLWGATAALVGGRCDQMMMRVVDVLYGLPYLLMIILLKIALSRPLSFLFGGHSQAVDVVLLFLAIGSVSWLTMARVVRGQVLSLRSRPFVEAARTLGAGPFWILRKHLVPNLVGPIVVYAALVVPQAVLQESFLSFLGIGVRQPLASLGRLAADGVQAVNSFVSYWWLLAFPCGTLVFLLLTLNFIGDGLRDAWDPRSTAGRLPG